MEIIKLIKMRYPNYLKRYTNFISMLDILYTKKLTLLSPDKWEDRNDSFSISEYKKKKQVNTVLALCFTSRPETFHHWKIFAGENGVCIEFNKKKLIEDINKFTVTKLPKENYIYKDITYFEIRKITSNELTIDDLPFIKRYPYRDETEFRIIYTNKNCDCSSSIPIEISSIKRITLSPWIPQMVADNMKKYIKAIPECKNLEINYSRLLETDKWKEKINEIKV